ncbi:50S ribosomal protein L28 [Entomospira culicis]|uniref:Large ribosomal subunit protein bL28 n=1 Tax=Entomospira culicis TaxID=2719989 RepID=A0A968KTX6_9SPIO|nr:50S ribosomal protein L28 [Entomospira culicis]NIZ18699.1 50S ribosomal protein L28 [Entomospira culicis]NIZ68914.1 50S ribosomal protein L28 [Entomospira culicis]WDI37507.1 50S ribosomal protein L28 [Entomospira culicis]WDI39135.1 50S ribosomal protein L28 [Entomospira culicis]
MSRECDFCGKATITGNSVPRKGKSKKQGGNGEHVVRRTGRTFKPNLFKVRALVAGRRSQVKVCAKCMKAGKVVKA